MRMTQVKIVFNRRERKGHAFSISVTYHLHVILNGGIYRDKRMNECMIDVTHTHSHTYLKYTVLILYMCLLNTFKPPLMLLVG